MRVSVLTVIPSQEILRDSATAAIEGRAPAFSLNEAAAPAGIELDPAFAAVPVGDATPGLEMAAATPDASDKFVVRGFMEVEDPTRLPVEVDGQPIFSDPEIAPLTCVGSPALGNSTQVHAQLNIPAMAARGLDGSQVAIAIMDTGINLAHLQAALGRRPSLDVANSWAAPGSTVPPGAYKVGHGTMCAYDALIAAPNATLLDFPILAASLAGGSSIAGTLSAAVRAYGQLLAFWAVANPGGGYRGMVVNNSWGVFHPSWDFPPGHPGRYIDNPRHPFNLLVGVLAGTGADIVFAAGNCGAQCPDGRCQGNTTSTIVGANASPDVLTLAGCDVNDLRVGYSSQGPAIHPFPRQKPDVTAYTHFLGSQAFGGGSPDSGTSAACPVAAGCVAAIRTKLSPLTAGPPAVFDALRQTARQGAGHGPGWNGDYGHGIIDADAAARRLGV